MRYVIFFTFFFFSLYAKSEDSCYSVSLLSVPDTEQNAKALGKNKYPLSSCKVMSISNVLTVRCGCFEKITQARKAAEFIAKRYKPELCNRNSLKL
ncbi:hypothetical protein [Sulfurimonas sp.]|uniref:hypothetical protein n=1 Tax=Sulfurimonas sp. TaxID=2022749 RepID=UPI002616D5BB|nr:hypothetical protein [Sulfurimonas sp.]